ncbi:MAG: tRNA threonylcarbamoyladenosine dehydratase [Clostridia bacterium]|nr:tRNA threonylcarbamoyladenosine dehydratase [Clostridia bacterium]MDD4386290.1 tRNA threonylcarbamoyladenosine dehydratase [Clostridia bacterium]
MLHRFSRTELLLGKVSMKKLQNSKVAIFGIGGVGSYAVEGLARAGIGKFILIDDDKICITNINRQIHATSKTVGVEKVEAMKNRILEINPKAEVITHNTFFNIDKAEELISIEYDYIIDAIDTITSKLDLIVKAKEKNIPIISSMGAGNKLDPTRFEIADINKTSMCPLAKVIRRELRKRNIYSLKTVYSREEPLTPISEDDNSFKNNCICPKETVKKCTVKRQIPGSISFVPSVVGLIIASEVVKDLTT